MCYDYRNDDFIINSLHSLMIYLKEINYFGLTFFINLPKILKVSL